MTGHYDRVLVVPACREHPQLFDGYRLAARSLSGRLLVIVVVNARVNASSLTFQINTELLNTLRTPPFAELAPNDGAPLTPAWLTSQPEFDVLFVDRSSEGHRFTEKQGVGLARRIGGDIALALWSRGQVKCPVMFCTDADTILPSDYFSRPCSALHELPGSRGKHGQVSAWLYPFRHRESGDAALDNATLLYDISLRYYVLGLAFAGSPYAYQSVGSTLAIDFESYAIVRGFPKLQAGEDFYLLDKLAKVRKLVRLSGDALEIMSRRSDRVPFGTGRASIDIETAIKSGESFSLYNPEVFVALRAWLSALTRFSAHREISELRAELATAVPQHVDTLIVALDKLLAFTELAAAAGAVSNQTVLLRRLHTWFDALKTLRLIHALTDQGLAKLSFREALARAEFVPLGTAELSAAHALDRLLLAESKLPSAIGPALFP